MSITTPTAPTIDEAAPQPDPNAPVITFDHVSIGFEGKKVLEDISFTVSRGETLIILGPAGGGKSVLMKLCDGLLQPDSGNITVFGREISHLKEEELYSARAHIGMVFQESALFDSLTVRDNVAYRLIEEHLPDEEVDRRVREALRFVELEDKIDMFPSELSGGMRRRVSIARAIISGPDLLLYDSPTAGLDPITSTTIVELIIKQRDVGHNTALLITHRLQDAFTLVSHRYNEQTKAMEPLPDGELDQNTRFIMLNEGHIVFEGTTLEFILSNDPFIRDYLS
jgi:phospholipid/cholesterol/gamma-HCH transport system ATP-binding protein